MEQWRQECWLEKTSAWTKIFAQGQNTNCWDILWNGNDIYRNMDSLKKIVQRKKFPKIWIMYDLCLCPSITTEGAWHYTATVKHICLCMNLWKLILTYDCLACKLTSFYWHSESSVAPVAFCIMTAVFQTELKENVLSIRLMPILNTSVLF